MRKVLLCLLVTVFVVSCAKMTYRPTQDQLCVFGNGETGYYDAACP